MNIVIINAYGYRNIGDEAILESALTFIKRHIKKGDSISIHAEKKDSIPKEVVKKYNLKTYQLPYGYAIRSKKEKVNSLMKIVRFSEIITFSLLYLAADYFSMKSLPSTGFYSYIKNIKNASVVMGMGGGYFISKSSIRDSFGLFLSLIPVYIAKLYKKEILFLPISFGPFASSLHEQATYNALKDTTVMSRDQITLNKITAIDNKKLIKTFFIPDLALFNTWSNELDIEKKLKSNYIVLTAREWLPPKQQLYYEQCLVKCIEYLANNKGYKTVFIPMASNSIEDNDHVVANRIRSQLNDRNMMKILSIKEPKEAREILRNAYISICTRLHSAILSTTVYTPFITIAYTDKTHGYLEYLNLKEWNINIEQVKTETLKEKIDKLTNKHTYNKFIDTLKHKRIEINEYSKVINNELINFI